LTHTKDLLSKEKFNISWLGTHFFYLKQKIALIFFFFFVMFIMKDDINVGRAGPVNGKHFGY